VSDQEWTVHVSGPDDVLPAKDYADAVKQANAINNWYATTVPNRTEFHPYAWATPCIKGRYAYPLTPEEMR
jgi:hypothetical protein